MMKHKKWLMGFSILLILSIIFCNVDSNKVSSYQQNVAKFTRLDVNQVSEKLTTTEEFVLYIGTETCSYCQQFVPLLKEVAQKKNLPIYYLDALNYENEKSLQVFLQKYDVLYFPTLLVYSKNQISFPEVSYNTVELEKLFKSYDF